MPLKCGDILLLLAESYWMETPIPPFLATLPANWGNQKVQL